MAAVHDCRWRRLLPGMLVLLALLPGLFGCENERMTMATPRNPTLEQANELVATVGRDFGVRDARLDENLDRSFGDAGLRYDPLRRTLIGRAYVGRIELSQLSEDERKNWENNYRALNDPAIGGMFERGGGRFVLDEDKEILFLVKEFPVATTSPRVLRREMGELMNLAAVWTFRWFRRVIAIANDYEPAPTSPVTRANDPR